MAIKQGQDINDVENISSKYNRNPSRERQRDASFTSARSNKSNKSVGKYAQMALNNQARTQDNDLETLS
eukprot:CAMPEP_0176386848 /NCGR_PEP_ID=MMETSP0126-20121128/36279_1 /TAXON_ID=141414 ORGANISM="Strombidinopsis acuminatum, Strain SPMC142" /NCGR_SAMPLE_ID=MMETSP0126 /ASSEMBLY_ACC=CAM_ASM_000229 /LENGTH=68 /DNA_ID=CAMNT_0017754057 /DNA_START=1749 /DNA_END=1955 /DNA_ORIENTATION=+